MSTTNKTLRIYWRHASRYPKHVWALLILVPITILVQQFLPTLIAAHILKRLSKHDYINGDLWGSFGNEILMYAGLVFIGGVILWRIIVAIVWHLEGMIVKDIHQDIFSHLMSQSSRFHANNFGGSLVSKANKFASSYVRVADTTLFDLFTLIVAFAFATIILLPKAPLYVALLLAVSAIYVVTAVLAYRWVRKLNADEAGAENTQTGYLADAITNVLAIKSFATGKAEIARYKKATEKTRRATMAVMRTTTKRDVYFGTVNTGIDILALVMAAVSVVIFSADIATVFLVLSYTSNLVHRLWEFSQHTLRNYNRALGDAVEMTQILVQSPEVIDPPVPEKPKIRRGGIEFHNVQFYYPDSSRKDSLFQGLSFRIKPGEKVGLVGHSGGGKTTIIRLILRFMDIQGGQIRIDGQDIAAITQDDLRARIAYVPQEPLLFHRSLLENISYSAPDADIKAVRAVSKLAHAHEFIQKLPEGYETLVGERGVKLSGGQRQRVAIARAMLKNSPILLLDEATSALDSESEKLIQEALWKLMENRTSIVIAHRLSTIQKMDRILVLEKGEVVEEGSHKELLRKKGVYAKLWAHQSGGFLEE